MKIAMIGGLGMLGSDLQKIYLSATNIPHDLIPVEKITAPVLDGFEVVINCSAYHDVRKCEDHPNRAFEVNYIGVRGLAEICHRLGIRLIHFSTNIVFNGKKWHAYEPTDIPDPKTVYGYSKWLGECAIRDQIQHGLVANIIRLAPIYGHSPCRGKGRNFVTTVLKLAQEKKPLSFPLDQTVNPLSTVDVAEAVSWVIANRDPHPVIHLGSSNSCSWYEFAREILHLNGLSNEVNPIFTEGSVKYPINGVLQPTLQTPTWQDSLSRYFSSEPEAA